MNEEEAHLSSSAGDGGGDNSNNIIRHRNSGGSPLLAAQIAQYYNSSDGVASPGAVAPSLRDSNSASSSSSSSSSQSASLPPGEEDGLNLLDRDRLGGASQHEHNSAEWAARQHVLDRDFGLHFGPMGGDMDTHLPGLGHVSIKTIAVAALFFIGTVAYRFTERLSWIDSMYCTTGVLTTVGQVIVPRSAAGRLFTAVFNLLSLGITVLFIMEVADARRDATRKALRHRAGLGGSSTRLEVIVLCAATVPTVLGMAALLMLTEGWSSYAEALYFCIITASGLGMGDVEPRRPLSRLLFIAYIFGTMGLMLTLAGTIGNALHEVVRSRLLQSSSYTRAAASAAAAAHHQQQQHFGSSTGGGGSISSDGNYNQSSDRGGSGASGGSGGMSTSTSVHITSGGAVVGSSSAGGGGGGRRMSQKHSLPLHHSSSEALRYGSSRLDGSASSSSNAGHETAETDGSSNRNDDHSTHENGRARATREGSSFAPSGDHQQQRHARPHAGDGEANSYYGDSTGVDNGCSSSSSSSSSSGGLFDDDCSSGNADAPSELHHRAGRNRSGGVDAPSSSPHGHGLDQHMRAAREGASIVGAHEALGRGRDFYAASGADADFR